MAKNEILANNTPTANRDRDHDRGTAQLRMKISENIEK